MSRQDPRCPLCGIKMAHEELCVSCYSDPTTARQHYSNIMLYMRRMMKEIALLLRLQSSDYEFSDEEADRVLQLAGWDDLRTKRALKRLQKRMEKIDV